MEVYADPGHEGPDRWTIPHTEITIARVEKGPRAGEFLFSPRTVRRALEFYRLTRHLPYRRQMVLENPRQVQLQLSGWVIPEKWIETLPGWLKVIILEQVLWKWLVLALLLLFVFGAVALVHRWLNRDLTGHSWGVYLCRLAGPTCVFILMSLVEYLTELLIMVTGVAAEAVQIVIPAVTYLAAAWAAWFIGLATTGCSGDLHGSYYRHSFLRRQRAWSASLWPHCRRRCRRSGHCSGGPEHNRELHRQPESLRRPSRPCR